MKTSATFKLSKYAKTMIALLPFHDKQQRNAFRKNMVEGEYYASTVERQMMGVNAKSKDE
jgi:hypothetical protein